VGKTYGHRYHLGMHAKRFMAGATILPNIEETTYKAWLPLVPEEARPPQSKARSVRIHLMLAADGRPRGLLLQKPSGDIVLDRAAWGAITNAQYAPFPQEFDLPVIQMAYTFNYNQGPPQGNVTKPKL
jgi:TonB family protein